MTTTTATTTTTTLGQCRCTCGRNTNSTYAPGHDAKHVSWLAKAVLAGTVDRDAARAELPSMALAIKFDGVILKALDKAATKQAKAEARAEARAALKAHGAKKANKATRREPANPQDEKTEVKIGRWWYPVTKSTQLHDDTFELSYTTRDGETRQTQTSADKIRTAN